MCGRPINKEDDKRRATAVHDDRIKAVMTRNGLTLYKRSDSSAMSKNSMQPDHSPKDAA
jgi:hypothetical protein